VVAVDGRRVCIVNRGSKSASVTDTTNDVVLTAINVGGDPAGVSVTPGGKHVLVANGGTNSISTVDASSNTVTATIGVDRAPSIVAMRPPSQ
jgi:YVTN family beta-propeller protein